MKHILLLIFILLLPVTSIFAYNFGDVITNPDGSKGVVFWLNTDGSGGWMVSLHDEATTAQWGDTVNVPSIPDNIYTLDYSDTAAYSNTQNLRQYFPSNSYAANLVDFNNGWYLPTVTQLGVLFSSLPLISPIIIANGGTDLKQGKYWSSTQVDSLYAAYFGFDDAGYWYYYKTYIFNVRAVHSFTNQSIQFDSTLTYQWSTGDTLPYIQVSPTVTTNYGVTASNKYGCSQTAQRTIFVGANQTEIINDTICEGNTYSSNGFNETTSGIYTRTVTGGNGCSLTIQLDLMVNPKKHIVIYDTTCVNKEYNKHGFYYISIDNPGDYSDSASYTTIHGCDSTVVLKLNVLPGMRKIINDNVCQGEPYSKNGFSLPEQKLLGTYIFERTIAIKNSYCDSTLELHLKVNPASFSVTNKTICEGDTFTFNGANYTKAGIYAAYLTNSVGCDSVATLRIIENKTSSSTIPVNICNGASYFFNGKNYSTPGTYVAHFKNSIGCDSSVTLTLTKIQVYNTPLNKSICKGSSYPFKGLNIKTAGTYTDSLHTIYGCDSVITLNLTINPPITNTIKASFCSGTSYLYRGNVLTVSGLYKDTLSTASGCDSIVTLDLSAIKPETTTLSVTINDGETYSFGGKSLTVAGTYSDTLQSYLNCDSVIILNLSVIQVVDRPDIFSPNNDGNNDLFVIKNLDKFPLNSILIFNRWGDKVWDAKPYLNNWDGTNMFGVTVGGNVLPVGTYFYLLNLGNGSPVKKGYIYLNR